jgi:peptidoglycan hydrolase-like protein with peptidoglycan-binding domain
MALVQMIRALLLCLGGFLLLPGIGGDGVLIASPPDSPSAKPKRAWRHPQRVPSRERYKQIQLALKNNGYNPGAIDGRWGSKTASALKRFEKDHGLRADGKLDALALITLGLGPEKPGSVSTDAAKAGASR